MKFRAKHGLGGKCPKCNQVVQIVDGKFAKHTYSANLSRRHSFICPGSGTLVSAAENAPDETLDT